MKKIKRVMMKTINKEAAKYNLELVKGEGYFYWAATTDEANTVLCMKADTTSVYVFKLNDLDFDRWMDELKSIVKIMKS